MLAVLEFIQTFLIPNVRFTNLPMKREKYAQTDCRDGKDYGTGCDGRER